MEYNSPGHAPSLVCLFSFQFSSSGSIFSQIIRHFLSLVALAYLTLMLVSDELLTEP